MRDISQILQCITCAQAQCFHSRRSCGPRALPQICAKKGEIGVNCESFASIDDRSSVTAELSIRPTQDDAVRAPRKKRPCAEAVGVTTSRRKVVSAGDPLSSSHDDLIGRTVKSSRRPLQNSCSGVKVACDHHSTRVSHLYLGCWQSSLCSPSLVFPPVACEAAVWWPTTLLPVRWCR